MAKYRSGSVIVEIEVLDALDQIDDDDLRDELHRRNLALNTPDPERDLQDAYEALLRGHVAEAKTILERILHPKWRTPQQCAADYAKARHTTGEATK